MPSKLLETLKQQLETLCDDFDLLNLLSEWTDKENSEVNSLLNKVIAVETEILKIESEKSTSEGLELLTAARKILKLIKQSRQEKTKNTMAKVDRVEVYDSTEPFSEWLEIFENYLELQKIEQSVTKVRYLIHNMGITNAKQLVKACKPKKVVDLTYDEVVDKCLNIFESKIDEIAANNSFYTMNQGQETINEYAIKLQAVAASCKFSDAELDKNLKNKFISGIADKDVKFELLKSTTLKTFAEAVSYATSIEKCKIEARNGTSQIHSVHNNKKYKPKVNEQKSKESKAASSKNVAKTDKKVDKTQCYFCKKKGHWKKDCYKYKNYLQNKTVSQLNIGNLSCNSIMSGEKEYVTVKLNGIQQVCEVDTGSPVLLMGIQQYKEKFSDNKLQQCKNNMSVANGQQLQVMGQFSADISGNDKEGQIRVVVQRNLMPVPLLGIEAMDIIFPEWRKAFNINQVRNFDFVKTVKQNFPAVIDGALDTPIRDVEVELTLKPDAMPIFAKALPIPLNLREQVGSMLDKMVEEKILETVEDAKWASPIVIPRKSDGTLRLCINPKKTLNHQLSDDHYPLPNITDLFVEIGGHEFYSIIDMKGAYQQLQLSEKSKELVTINTHRGLFRFTRLPFGVKTASSIFQRVIEQILKPFEWAFAYIDDIIIISDSKSEMEDRLMTLFHALVKHNVKVNLDKCKFLVKEVKYLGHKLTKEGLSPADDKVQAISNAQRPTNVKELQSFLGLVNYCAKFIHKLSDKASPLLKLLNKNAKYQWDTEQEEAFNILRSEMSEGKILAHYNSHEEISVFCDASDVGISGVLCHKYQGSHRPVFFVSRTLTSSERNYPILHRELLAIVFSLEKFYKYVYGKKITIFTDHKPLLAIVKKGTYLPMVATRVHRYLFRLMPFDVEIFYKPGKSNNLADFASRFPISADLSQEDREEEQRYEINLIEDNQNIDLKLMAEYTAQDNLLMKLKEYIIKGWPENIREDMKPYSSVKELLSISRGVILRDQRVVVPRILRNDVMRVLHKGHLGITQTKQLARQYFYWPGLNKDIEISVKACETCKAVNADKTERVYSTWPTPTVPFERVHLDFFHFQEKTFLIMVDSFSKWVDVKVMQKTDLQAVQRAFLEMFENFGDPGTVVTDNGPPFGSPGFDQFLINRKIKPLKSPPYHPASNGSAERWVQTVKNKLKKAVMQSPFTKDKLIELLFLLRNTPSSGKIPSHEVFSFKPRTDLEKFMKEVKNLEGREDGKGTGYRKEENPESMIPRHRIFSEREIAFVKTPGGGNNVKCEIIQKVGKVTYKVKIGELVKLVHANQLIKFQGEKRIISVPAPVEENVVPPLTENQNGSQTPVRIQRNRKAPFRYQAPDWRKKK